MEREIRKVSLENELQEFVSHEILLDAGQELVGVNEPLMTSGRVDSMGLLSIVSHIQERYQVDILATGDPDDFNTISGLAAAVQRAKNAS
jgi:acyl carrier protein